MSKDKGFTDRDMAEVADNPEWTDEELATAVPFARAFPDLAASLRSRIEIVTAPMTGRLSVALSGDVAAYYRSFGDESEARLNADLRKLAGLSG